MRTNTTPTAISAASIDNTRQMCRRTGVVSVAREDATWDEAMISHFRSSGTPSNGLVECSQSVTTVINVSHVAGVWGVSRQRVADILDVTPMRTTWLA